MSRAVGVDGWIAQAEQWAGKGGVSLGALALAVGAVVAVLALALVLVRRRRPAAPPPPVADDESGRVKALALANIRADGAARAADVAADLLAALAAAGPAAAPARARAERLEELGGNLTLTATTLIGLARGWSRSGAAIEPAIAALRRGETAPAREVLRAVAAAVVGKEGGETVPSVVLVRHLATLAFIHDPAEALEPARWLTDHAPDSAESWMLSGTIAAGAGELQQARAACEKVLGLAVATAQRPLSAGALGILGEVHQAFGNLERAEEYYRIALTYQASLERPAAMASLYDRLAQVYETARQWPRAAETLEKASALVAATDPEAAAALAVRARRVARHRDGAAS